MKPHIKVIQRNGVDVFVTNRNAISQTDYDRFGKSVILFNTKIKVEVQKRPESML